MTTLATKSALLLTVYVINFISALSWWALPVTASAQTLSPASREAMRGLDFLVGEWKGKGWLYRVEGPGSEISQSTKVTIEVGGAVLRIKEKKSYKDAGLPGAPMRIPESTVSYDDEAKLYRWSVDAAKGRGNPFEAKLVGPRTFQLIVHTPGGMARTTIKVTEDGQWHQTVELLLADGWFKFQETTLKKVK